MKVLQVNNIFPTRSTGKITADIHEELQRNGVDSVVCYRYCEIDVNEPKAYCIGASRFIGLGGRTNAYWIRLSGLLYGGCLRPTARLKKIICREKPDVVHLQCINGQTVNIYHMINWLKKKQIKTVVTLHAEFMYTANCGIAFECEKWKTGCGNCPRWKEEVGDYFRDGSAESWRRMKEAFSGFEKNCIVSSVSPWLMERAKQAPILKEFQHVVVFNGLDTRAFYPRSVEEVRKQWGISNEKIIFHATANFSDRTGDLKGGRYVLELAEKFRNERVKIFVAGPVESGISLPENVVLLGNLNDKDLLARYYSMADVTLLTSKRETFSMVLAESLCCGTPVVGFQAGGPESIAIKEYSTFVKYGDVNALENQVRQWLATSVERKNIACAAAKIYSAQAMCANYLQVYNMLLDEESKGESSR